MKLMCGEAMSFGSEMGWLAFVYDLWIADGWILNFGENEEKGRRWFYTRDFRRFLNFTRRPTSDDEKFRNIGY